MSFILHVSSVFDSRTPSYDTPTPASRVAAQHRKARLGVIGLGYVNVSLAPACRTTNCRVRVDDTTCPKGNG
jgi:hypothetical protein